MVRGVLKVNKILVTLSINMMNEISVYWPQMKSRKMIIETLIHEYQHYLQSPSWFKRYYNMGYEYHNHPYELQATQKEQDYKLFI